jgi:chromosome segregation ATPase
MADNRSSNGKPAQPTAQNGKIKKAKKSDDPFDQFKLVQQAISQIESKQAGDREQDQEIVREVNKAMRETTNDMKAYESAGKKLDYLSDQYKDLLLKMKRLEREYRVTKRKADQVQKEKDSAKSELGKMTNKKNGLENLSKDLHKQVKDLRVSRLIPLLENH